MNRDPSGKDMLALVGFVVGLSAATLLVVLVLAAMALG